MNSLRGLRRGLGLLRARYSRAFDLFRWENFKADELNSDHLRVHLLVIKNSKYSQIARICTTSFLHFHPKSTVIIHVDEYTQGPVTAWVSKSKFTRSIKIELQRNSKQQSWQVQKTNLVVGLSGSLDIFVDADMRWNGPIDSENLKSSTILFFVEEYKIVENKNFASMLEHVEFNKFNKASMWNTSFVTFSGYSLNDAQKNQIIELQNKIIEYASRFMKEETLSSSTIRISEQLAISLAVSSWDVAVGAIKKVDGYKDGAFLESSYFGATGTQF